MQDLSADEDIWRAITHAVHSDDIDPEPLVRRLHLGPDRPGNMLEGVTLHFDDGGVLALRVMKMTKQYRRLTKGHRNDEEEGPGRLRRSVDYPVRH